MAFSVNLDLLLASDGGLGNNIGSSKKWGILIDPKSGTLASISPSGLLIAETPITIGTAPGFKFTATGTNGHTLNLEFDSATMGLQVQPDGTLAMVVGGKTVGSSAKMGLTIAPSGDLSLTSNGTPLTPPVKMGLIKNPDGSISLTANGAAVGSPISIDTKEKQELILDEINGVLTITQP